MKRILLAEDDGKIALALTIRLQQAGYEVIAVPDGLLGYKWTLSTKPDLVLMDIVMPGANGFQVAAELRKAGLARVPVIFITASKKPELRGIAGSLGAVGFFEKPFETEELIASISKALRTTAIPTVRRPGLKLALEQNSNQVPKHC